MIDLHIHSTYSDGTKTPKEIVEMAKKKGLKAISITDHDTVDGLIEGEKYAKDCGIEFIKGIEISANYYGKEIHILGYFLNTDDEIFMGKIKEFKEQREKRNEKILEKLDEIGFTITMEELKKEAKEDLISRTHIGSLMIKKAYVNNKKDAFLYYLGIRGKAYVAKNDMEAYEAIKILKDNGALSFIAHPKLIPYGMKRIKELITKGKEVGLDGIEVFYPRLTDYEINYYYKIAEKRGLLFSGGSDYHGENREGIEIGGISVPDFVYSKMQDRMLEQNRK